MGQAREPRENRWNGLMDWVVGWPLEVVAGLLAIAMFASWAPGYLTWPWWCDTEAWANHALSWSKGVLPYRDIRGGNFPVSIYVFWVLGELFGWGWPVIFNALDAGLVAFLGIALVFWSRAIFSRAAPGIAGFLAFESYYFNLDYTDVAQRDWHGPLAAVLSIMVLQIGKGRFGIFVSALFFALALGYRPHVVLFLPGLLLALDARVRAPGEPLRKSVRAILGWGAVASLGFALVLLPLILSGIADDFFNGFLVATQGGKIAGFSLRERFTRLSQELFTAKFVMVPLAVLILARCSSGLVFERARPWIVAMAGAFLYRVFHPTPHHYLWQPLVLFWSINLALLIGLVLSAPASRSGLTVAFLLCLTAFAVPYRPLYCNPQLSIAAIPRLLKGEQAKELPYGIVVKYEKVGVACHPWQDYTRLLDYLRRETTPETRVANALRSQAAINGPIGRMSPYSAESGLLWAWMIDTNWKQDCILDLEKAQNCLVVWIPKEADEPNQVHPTDFLKATIIKYFEPAEKFGAIEVWKRKPGL